MTHTEPLSNLFSGCQCAICRGVRAKVVELDLSERERFFVLCLYEAELEKARLSLLDVGTPQGMTYPETLILLAKSYELVALHMKLFAEYARLADNH